MKKLMIAVALVTGSGVASAVSPGGPNCGWGNMLFEGQSGLPSHAVASITNGTSGNNTFGMTSGTNGCSADGTLTYGGKKMINLGAVMDEFSEDVARGDGEALTAMAVSLGISAEDRPLFKETLHNNFETLFPSAEVDADFVVSRIFALMQSEQGLAKYAS